MVFAPLIGYQSPSMKRRVPSLGECDVLVIGGVNADYLVRGHPLPRAGETIEGSEFFHGPGGKGANQAVAAARLGAKVALLARVGDDPCGAELIRQLRSEGVETRFIQRDLRAATGAAVIMVDERGEKQIFTAPGANRNLSPAGLREATRAGLRPRVVLMQFEAPCNVLVAGARWGRSIGAIVVLDPAPPVAAPDVRLLRLVDVIRPNASEALALTGIRARGLASAERAARALQGAGVKNVALPVGEEGDIFRWAGGQAFLPRHRVRSVDSTGAGDAFVAGLAVALAEGMSFAEAGEFASAAGALATTKVGAQSALPRRRDLMRLLRKPRRP